LVNKYIDGYMESNPRRGGQILTISEKEAI